MPSATLPAVRAWLFFLHALLHNLPATPAVSVMSGAGTLAGKNVDSPEAF